jgi:hypothetical protein
MASELYRPPLFGEVTSNILGIEVCRMVIPTDPTAVFEVSRPVYHAIHYENI